MVIAHHCNKEPFQQFLLSLFYEGRKTKSLGNFQLKCFPSRPLARYCTENYVPGSKRRGPPPPEFQRARV